MKTSKRSGEAQRPRESGQHPHQAKLGFHIDLRVQEMPLQALKSQAKELSGMGYEMLLIEWEASFPFERHATLCDRFAYTREEIRDFVRSCSALGLEVVPLQQCFGHIEYILKHERYAALRENEKDLCQLCPCKEAEAVEIFSEIFAEVAALHPSEYFHIGGDETYLLGRCPRCQKKAARVGKSRLYVDFLRRMADLVVGLGKRPVAWADVILQHPDAVHRLPKSMILMDWNYGWDVNNYGDYSKLLGSGFELWGASSLRSWPDNHSFTFWKTHFGNLAEYVQMAKTHGFSALFQTSWSTSGEFGYQWCVGYAVLDVYPIRRVYPLRGFRVLTEGFIAAATAQDDFDPREFVVEYARKRFGFAPKEGSLLYRALCGSTIPLKSTVDIQAARREALLAVRRLDQLKPKKNKTEFAHYQLMADFREFHTRWYEIELAVQSPKFTNRRRKALAEKLDAMAAELPSLNARYLALNKGFIYRESLLEDIEYRTLKFQRLRAQLARSGRDPEIKP